MRSSNTNIFRRTLKKHRKITSALSSSVPPADVVCKHYKGFKIYTPLEGEGPFPTLIYVPGNAFIASEIGYTHFICSHIAKKSRCQIIVVEHKLAPEFRFPDGLKDACKILLLLKRPSVIRALNIDIQRIAIAGYSSGGNLVASMTILAKTLKLPFVRQILISPTMDLSRSLKGFEHYEQEDTAISEQFVKWFLDLYVPKRFQRTDPLLSPYWVNKNRLQGLPPTDIIFGEFDRFRGDSERFGKRLFNQGNRTCLFMFPKENHGLLWHNAAVIQTISARLMLTFKSERLEWPISKDMTQKDSVSILYLKLKQPASYKSENSKQLKSHL